MKRCATYNETLVRYDLKGSTTGRRASKRERTKGAAATLNRDILRTTFYY